MELKEKYHNFDEKKIKYFSVDTMGKEGVLSEDFLLWLMTGADDLPALHREMPVQDARMLERAYQHPMRREQGLILSTPISKLEKQLLDDYSRQSGRRGESLRGLAAAALHRWEYRTTGMRDFKITALSPIFGVEAGQSLNKYFSIYEFKPKQIVSHRTQNLLWGYSDKEEITDIAQWLSLEPMAPPVVIFRLNTKPKNLPLDIKFVSTLETTTGKTLRDTIAVVLR